MELLAPPTLMGEKNIGLNIFDLTNPFIGLGQPDALIHLA